MQYPLYSHTYVANSLSLELGKVLAPDFSLASRGSYEIVSLCRAEDAGYHPSLDKDESQLKFNPTVVDAVPFCPNPLSDKGVPSLHHS